ncbi:heme-degrading monooxygenase HmoA [Catenulispora sp. GAS73]|uniref:antibiotic biosynthesis monooxygenase family protein n=1 Tax=Catenulispora sp. GAS73 TaxID=3156269 RepID=UPI003512CB4C
MSTDTTSGVRPDGESGWPGAADPGYVQLPADGFTTALVMDVPDGHSAEFEQAWEQAAGQVADLDGNIHQVLLRPTHLPHTYVVISKWRDEQTFHEFERSRSQDELTATLRRLREGIVMSTPIMVRRIEGRKP